MSVARPAFTVIVITKPREALLGRAVLSALLQDEVSHEVVVVLDGACEANRAQLAPLMAWPGLRVVEHARPRGRGAARATGVEHARGEWISFVDADDWLFAEKLATQQRFLEERPTLEIASMGLMITDRAGGLAGVRRGAREGFGVAPGAFPELPSPSMVVRAELARAFPFDASRWAGEDRDFLYRVLPGRAWALQDAAAYVYEEYASHSLGRCLQSYGRRAAMAWTREPWHAAARMTAISTAKAGGALAAFAVGQGDALVARRSRAPEADERAAFARAQDAMQRACREYFGGG